MWIRKPGDPLVSIEVDGTRCNPFDKRVVHYSPLANVFQFIDGSQATTVIGEVDGKPCKTWKSLDKVSPEEQENIDRIKEAIKRSAEKWSH